jgi:hypothetical protein
MLKRFAFLAKRDDISTESFIDRYENHHVPLILSVAPAPLVYKRHYVVRGDAFTMAEDNVDFDVLTEMAWADHDAHLAWTEAIRAAADRVSADEARFLDRSRIRSVLVDERVSAG